MAWNDVASNQMVSYFDASTSGIPLLSGQSHFTTLPNANQCMDKTAMQAKYNLDATNLSTYTSLQLVPKSAWSNVSSCLTNQQWDVTNATHTTYRDGTIIPQHTGTDAAWAALTTGAWCYPNNSSGNNGTYGKLYNWYAVAGIWNAASMSDSLLRKQFAPINKAVPTSLYWYTFITCLGGESVAGEKMKSTSAVWTSPNIANNTSGFSALPAGTRRHYDGAFVVFGSQATFWTSTQFVNAGGVLDPNQAVGYSMSNSFPNVGGYAFGMTAGKSVRLINQT